MRNILAIAILLLAPVAPVATFAGDFYLIGAEWCPGCRVMKTHVPRTVKLLDWDRDAKAKAMLRGKTIPQLVYLDKSGRRVDVTGVYSPAQVREWMAKAQAGGE